MGGYNKIMKIKRTVLHTAESQYGHYKVVDMMYNGRPSRLLFGDKASPQSGTAKDDEPYLLFDYNQRFLEIIISTRPKRVLVIGGGAFMLPTAAYNRFPNLKIDVVEIDATLVDISKKYFDLPDSTRLTVYVEDGAKFIADTKEKYDMIIIDAFSGYSIPHHLLENDTVRHYKKHLKKSGVLAINFISEYKPGAYDLAHELVDTFNDVFSNVELYQADATFPRGEQQNMLLIANRSHVDFDYLNSFELELL